MKRSFAFTLALFAALLLFSACAVTGETAATPTPGLLPGGASGNASGEGTAPTPTVAPIPPDSIWTLQAKIDYRQVLEEGYYADYTIELDFVKLGGAYPSGQYTGDAYMSLQLDADDYIKDMLKALPAGMASINFDAQSHGLRNAIPINVLGFTEFQKEGTPWASEHTKNAGGEQVSPGAEEYVADTSFSMSFQTVLVAGGQGSTGAGSFKVGDFNFSESGDETVRIRVIIEPDSVWGNDFYAGTGGTRKVQIFFDTNGTEFSGEGTLTRQPNGEANQQAQINRERLGEKHNVEENP